MRNLFDHLSSALPIRLCHKTPIKGGWSKGEMAIFNLKARVSKVLITAVLISLLILATSVLFIPQSQAASKGWRYWGYFQAAPGATKWTAAMTGPTVDIADGAVEGWIFTFSADDVPSTPPSVKPNFKQICGSTKVQADKKRIGLVIDFGGRTYAPKGEKIQKTIVQCVVTAKESQGLDVLGQVVDVRQDESGLICGFNGYPVKECGVEITTPKSLLRKK
mgnify:CR=1 FL=1